MGIFKGVRKKERRISIRRLFSGSCVILLLCISYRFLHICKDVWGIHKDRCVLLYINVFFVCCNFHKKGFRKERRNGLYKDVWHSELGGVKTIVYD